MIKNNKTMVPEQRLCVLPQARLSSTKRNGWSMKIATASILSLLFEETNGLHVAAFQPQALFQSVAVRPLSCPRRGVGIWHSVSSLSGREAPGGPFMTSEGGNSGARPEAEADKKELEHLRRVAAQAQRQPESLAEFTRAKTRALQQEFETKFGLRKKIVDKAKELLCKAAADQRLATAVTDTAVEAVLAKNPQVALLDADLLRISNELKQLVPPGLCALAAPSKRYGYVREMNAMPLVLALQKGNDRARRIADIIITADAELRFLNDNELRAIELEIATGDNPEGALLRSTAAKILRDFQATIVEGAKEAISEEMPAVVADGGELANEDVAGAYFKELQHLLRLCHYATCGALASFTDDAQVLLVQQALAQQRVPTSVLHLSLVSMQKRANFLCKCSQAAPKCWVASHYALLHLIERLCP